jgi:hypothetical protein
MPIDRNRYPADWGEIATAVKEAAGSKCQRCGASHLEDGTMGACLTVHHPDRDPENPEAKTEPLCARRHLREEARARGRGQARDQLRFF